MMFFIYIYIYITTERRIFTTTPCFKNPIFKSFFSSPPVVILSFAHRIFSRKKKDENVF